MKKIIVVLLMLIMMISLAGCANADEKNITGERATAVKVLEIEESEKPIKMQYIGTVDSKEIIHYSFKTDGKLDRVYVKKGDEVKSGDKLAELEQQDLQYALRVAEGQLFAAETQYDKAINGASEEEINRMKINLKRAEDALVYTEDLYHKMKALYEEGAISKQQLDQIKLEYDIGNHNVEEAKEALKEMERGTRTEDKLALKAQYDIAKANYELQKKVLEDAILYAEQAGTIVDILFEENERIAAYTPVIIIRSGKQVINVGIPQQDLQIVHIGAKVMVDIDGEKTQGVISYIAEAPDLATRTYPTEIEVSEKQFRLGSIVKAEVAVGNERGVWISMTNIFSDGEDYVYIVKEDRAFKRIVELLNISDDKVMVRGIEVGELLAINGMKNLNDGSKVNIVE